MISYLFEVMNQFIIKVFLCIFLVPVKIFYIPCLTF
jgi:hypothetical protein